MFSSKPIIITDKASFLRYDDNSIFVSPIELENLEGWYKDGLECVIMKMTNDDFKNATSSLKELVSSDTLYVNGKFVIPKLKFVIIPIGQIHDLDPSMLSRCKFV